jgi:peptidoglycan/LPS O-acetylase OafA/YrhL
MLRAEPQYRRDIDGLRALSILAVVAFHAFPNSLPGGFAGVDVFFVVSGFLITSQIADGLAAGSFNTLEFYARRARRLFPALITILTTCTVLGWLILFPDEYRNFGKHLLGSAAFIANFTLLTDAGYFDGPAEFKPLLHLWSLGVEEQFYVVWPAAMILFWRRSGGPVALTAVVLCASFAANIWLVAHHPIAAFYLPVSRFWELMIGALLALGTTKFLLGTDADHSWMSIVGVALIVAATVIVRSDDRFPGWWALLPTIGTALVIAAGPTALMNARFLSRPPLVYIGLISYPLYLWHWPLLAFLRVVQGDAPSREFRIGAIALSIVLATLTYLMVERPLRRGKAIHLKTVSLAVVVTVIGCFGLFVYGDGGLDFRTIAVQARDFETKGDVQRYVPCDMEPLKSANLNQCLFDPLKTPTAAIIGDSHAGDKFHGLIQVDRSENWMLIGHTSCPPVQGIYVESDQKGCDIKYQAIFKYLTENHNIESVALSFFGNYFATESYAADHIRMNLGPGSVKLSIPNEDGPMTRPEIFFSGLQAAVALLLRHGKKVAIFIDVPELPFFPKDCFRNPLKKCQVSKNEVLTRQFDLRKMITKLKASYPSVTIFDPLDIICLDSSCGYKHGGVIIYRDSHHLTVRGSRIFAEHYLAVR